MKILRAIGILTTEKRCWFISLAVPTVVRIEKAVCNRVIRRLFCSHEPTTRSNQCGNGSMIGKNRVEATVVFLFMYSLSTLSKRDTKTQDLLRSSWTVERVIEFTRGRGESTMSDERLNGEGEILHNIIAGRVRDR